MQTKMLIDLNEHIRKGDPAPKGQEARYVRAGLAAEVKAAPAKKAAPKKKRTAKKPAAKPSPAPTPTTEPSEA